MVLILTLKGVRHLISPRWLEEMQCFSLSLYQASLTVMGMVLFFIALMSGITSDTHAMDSATAPQLKFAAHAWHFAD